MNHGYDKFIAISNHNILKTSISGEESFTPESAWYDAYLAQIEKIASLNVSAIVLREKDLSEESYCLLAKKCIEICKRHNTRLILHNFLNTALSLDHPYIHLPLYKLEECQNSHILTRFQTIGTSVHSVEDALLAEKLGADYLFAGNIYETDCKAGLPGRGLNFLRDVCKKTSLPVYAIGGMNTDRLESAIQSGAAGACMMSGFMKL